MSDKPQCCTSKSISGYAYRTPPPHRRNTICDEMICVVTEAEDDSSDLLEHVLEALGEIGFVGRIVNGMVEDEEVG